VDIAKLTAGDAIHISSSILDGTAYGNSWNVHRRDWKNQHVIWAHAEKLLSQPGASQQDRELAVIQLHRAVEHRDRLLDEVYGFEQIPGKKGCNKYDIMTDLGLIRPNLKKPLRELRNSLVHQITASPLTTEQCAMLSDAAWYYIKVTDHIAQQSAEEVEVEPPLGEKRTAGLSLKVKKRDWTVYVKDGSIHPDFLQERAAPDSLSVRMTHCEFVTYDGTLRFQGDVTGSQLALGRIIQIFFDESNLGY
jgi:hypothetical protein